MSINRKQTLHPGRWLRLVRGVRCPAKVILIPNWNRSLAKKQWERGFRLLYRYPRPGWDKRRRYAHKSRRSSRRKNRSHRVRRRVRRRKKGCHRVRRGQNLWMIAKRYRISIRKIKHLNPQRRRVLYVGAWLRLRATARCPRS